MFDVPGRREEIDGSLPAYGVTQQLNTALPLFRNAARASSVFLCSLDRMSSRNDPAATTAAAPMRGGLPIGPHSNHGYKRTRLSIGSRRAKL